MSAGGLGRCVVGPTFRRHFERRLKGGQMLVIAAELLV